MRKLKILIVDDNRNLAFLLRQRLEDEGHEVATAHSAEEGFAAFLKFAPTLVLTDISMGEVDGFEFVRRIRSHNPRVRTIYMTGEVQRYQNELDMERRAHCAQVLEKPFGGKELVEAIAGSIARRGRVAA